MIVGNFLTMLGVTLIFATDLHHLVIAALNDSYTAVPAGRGAADRRRRRADDAAPSRGAFRIGIQLSAPFLVFGLLFNLGLGVLSRLMPQMQVFFVGVPLSILIGFLILLLVVGAMMMTLPRLCRRRAARARALFVRRGHDGRRTATIPTRSEDPTQKRLDEALKRGDVAKSQEVNTWFVIAGGDAGADGVLRLDEQRPHHDAARAARQRAPDSGRRARASCDRAEDRHRGASRRSRSRSLLLVLAAIAGNMIQHRLVWSAEPLKPKLSKISPLAGLQAAVLQAGAGEFRQGPGQARADRRGHDGAAVAGAPPARRPGDASIRRRSCR